MANKKLITIFIVSVILFIFILVSYSSFFAGIDLVVNEFFYSIRLDFFVGLANIIGFFTGWFILLPLSLLFGLYFWLSKKRKQSAFFVIAMLLTFSLTQVLKYFINRARPHNALVDAIDYSFPSGHAVTNIVFIGLLLFLFSRKRKNLHFYIIGFLFSLIVVISRLYLNVHWFSDIIGGIMLGVAISSAFILLYER